MNKLWPQKQDIYLNLRKGDGAKQSAALVQDGEGGDSALVKNLQSVHHRRIFEYEHKLLRYLNIPLQKLLRMLQDASRDARTV